MKRSTPSSDTSNELPVEQQNTLQNQEAEEPIPSKKQKIGKHHDDQVVDVLNDIINQVIWCVNYNKSKQNLKEYAGHIVGRNRGNLLKTVVNSFATTYVWNYPMLVDEILVRCQMMDENFIANYVKQLPDNINIKGNAEEPVDLLDSDEEVDHGAHDDGFVDGVVEADSSEEEDDYDNSPAHADHDASSQQSSNAGSQGEQHANLGSKKGSKEGEEEEEVAVNV